MSEPGAAPLAADQGIAAAVFITREEDSDALSRLILGRPAPPDAEPQKYGWQTVAAAAADLIRLPEFHAEVLSRFREYGTLPHEKLSRADFARSLAFANRTGLAWMPPGEFGGEFVHAADLEKLPDRQFVDEVHLTLLARAPALSEVESCLGALARGELGKRELIKAIVQSPEYRDLDRPMAVIWEQDLPARQRAPVGAALSWMHLVSRVFANPHLNQTLSRHYGPAARGFLRSLDSALRIYRRDAAAASPTLGGRPQRQPLLPEAAAATATAATADRASPEPRLAAARTHAFTIACVNYAAQIRVLYESFRRFHPDWDFTIFLCDRIGNRVLPFGAEARVVEIESVTIPNFEEMRRSYDLTEINTAVKPYCFMHVFENYDPDFVAYIDPDILFFSRMEEFEDRIADGVEIILTPHTFEAIEDAEAPDDYTLALAGIYNLGFCGIRNSREGRRFVAWWARKLARDCRIDLKNGIFVDQKWCDAVPALFERVHVLRHSGYNAAYWNLMHRPLSRSDGGEWRAAADPLRFFHFSGLEMDRAGGISRHQTRFSIYDVNADTRELFADYRYALISAEFHRYSREPYLLAMSSGLFRNVHLQAEFERAAQSLLRGLRIPVGRPSEADLNDFRIAACLGHAGGVCLTDFCYVVHKMREDVRGFYPDLGSATDASGFLDWMRNSFFNEMPVGDEAAERIAASLRANELAIALAGKETVEPDIVPERYQELLCLCDLSVPHLYRIVHSFSEPAAFALRWRQAGEAPLPLFLVALHAVRPELRTAFDLATADGRSRLLGWFVSDFEQEYGSSSSARRLAEAVAEKGAGWVEKFVRPHAAPVAAVAAAPSPAAAVAPALFQAGRRDAESFAMSAAVSDADGRAHAAALAPGVSLIGYPQARMGMGEHIRGAAAALAEVAVPFDIFNFNWDYHGAAGDHSCDEFLTSRPRRRVNLLCINADQTLVANEVLGAALFAGRYNIGYWAWELEIFPTVWCAAIDLVDELWAPSRFVQSALRRRTAKPVMHVPLVARMPQATAFDPTPYRLDPGRFSFLFYFDLHSYHQRKNPFAVIDAFQTAFPKGGRHQACLIVKTINSTSDPEVRQQLLDLAEKDHRIRLIEQVLDGPGMAGLVDYASCLVSLHRSEGFGFSMAEAMNFGKPVIATRYSGNLDFMDDETGYLVDYRLVPVPEGAYPHSQGARWADPDVEHAAKLMRSVYHDPAEAKRRGAAGQRRIRAQFSAAPIGRLMHARLREIGET